MNGYSNWSTWKERGFLWRWTATIFVLGTFASCAWFPESTFTLSADSRLPRWISLHGVTRSEVSVRVDFIVPLTGAYARITVLSRNGDLLQRLDAKETSSIGPQSADGAPAHGVYPNYQVVAVDGVADIFELREANNTLRMCDDPAVWGKLAPKAVMPGIPTRPN